MTFEDRQDAGRRLAPLLERYRGARPVVLGLPRGGVPVAAEVAAALGAPLDVLVSHKVGAPGMPEYAVGAAAEGGVVVVSADAAREVGLPGEEVLAFAEREQGEIERRARLFRGGRPPPDLSGRTAILVDDGVATGCTARAAVRAARKLGAARVVVAAPVAAPDARAALAREADDVVFVEVPEGFFAVGAFYRDFRPTTDDEVVQWLSGARGGGEAPRARPPVAHDEGEVTIQSDGLEFPASAAVPPGAKGVVVFSHGSASSRRNPRDRYLARCLRERGLGTVFPDLEAPEGVEGGFVERRARRLLAAARWLAAREDTARLPAGLIGSSSGAAPALAAAALAPGCFSAVVLRGGRPDLAGEEVVRRVRTPTLLIVGGRDDHVLRLNEAALRLLPGRRSLAVVPGAGHAFAEPGALDAAARLGAGWFEEAFRQGAPR
ncbi:MAG TPA: phosphoribosyltransferase family protein [Anaeromyxobacteraceae bacterium]|nr:phosphoribosyltransferase family protein [Anaeromyxobacteraceae bacterium]